MISKKTRRALIVCGVNAGFSMAAAAQDKANEVNLSTTIIGNQEQPKVLYIVPWKPVDASELQSQGIESQLRMVFEHVEPSELRRELRFRKQLSGGRGSEATE